MRTRSPGRRLLAGFAAAVALLAGVSAAGAQGSPAGFPMSAVKLVVTTGAGSGPDVIARIVADFLSRAWGQQVFVVNHPGAAVALGMKVAGSATPDGYTLLYAQSSSFVALPEIQSSFPYDLLRDFVPIGFIGEQPMALAVSPKLGVDTLGQFIALAKSKPGSINIAVLSRGGIPHLTAEWLKLATATEMTAVNYSGAPQALSDVMGGNLQAIFDGLPSLAGNITGGSIKLMAIGSQMRLPNFPDVPTAAETVPGFKALGFFAIMAPPGTPAPITGKISADLAKVLADPELIAKFHAIATYPRPMTPAEMVTYVHHEQQLWKPVIEKIGMKAAK